jgi:hypothetical protein
MRPNAKTIIFATQPLVLLFEVYRVSMLNCFQILMMICQILMALAHLFGSQASEALKLLRQMALAGEADL